VGYISSVSGGSLATAYFGLEKPERGVPVLDGKGLTPAYKDFFAKFQKDMARDYELSFIRSVFMTDATERANLLSQSWDEAFFKNATFLDLYNRERAGHSPKLVLNGTSWDSGRRVVMTTLPSAEFSFDFTNEVLKGLEARKGSEEDVQELRKQAKNDLYRFRPLTFDEIGADPRNLRVSLAVAGSASVPLVIGPVTFQVQGSDKKYHVGDGGMFDNQGIESLAQLFFKKLREPTDVGKKGLIIVVDASYPFGASDEELNNAKTALDLLKVDPSRASDIMEQRARSYQLLLWAHLRQTGTVVPRYDSLRIVYLRHIDVNAAIIQDFPKQCLSRIDGEPTLEKIRILLSRIPTRFKIDEECHVPLLRAAAKNVVEANRSRITDFFGASH
jgi:predicted acylesterase/phospholipase RssA